MKKSTRRMRRFGLLGLAVSMAATLFPTGSQAAPPSGEEDTAKIIGGVAASRDEFPFMVSLQTSRGHFCGGSLYRSTMVLTAAHCVLDIVADGAGNGVPVSEVTAVIGRTNHSDKNQGVERKVELREVSKEPRITIHPNHMNQVGFDLAIVHLDKPVTGIAPVRVPTKGTDALIAPGSMATVIGWGNTDTDLGRGTERLRKVDVPILSQEECLVNADRDINGEVEICAGRKGKDSCQGDSGGPLLRKVPGRDEYLQIGVVSRGAGCAAQGGPGIYSYLGSQLLWRTMGSLG
ncbi:trypsin [Austwickia chelonae]|uniref:Putative peptidase n=1 Tax=Austwickia chelonae NBRC 105200 TaxID=1184607 RepID=K6ULM5_9MICO|nr:serine protease [Austwickia chelonae]GAB77376.1 putative peptidase [Austwickia chelonae NBRC 105200]SEW09033.1 trypsin [Austwickia chelonae]